MRFSPPRKAQNDGPGRFRGPVGKREVSQVGSRSYSPLGDQGIFYYQPFVFEGYNGRYARLITDRARNDRVP